MSSLFKYLPIYFFFKFFSNFLELKIFIVILIVMNMVFFNFAFLLYNLESIYTSMLTLLFSINFNYIFILFLLSFILFSNNIISKFIYYIICYLLFVNVDNCERLYKFKSIIGDTFVLNYRLENGLFIIHPTLIYCCYAFFIFIFLYFIINELFFKKSYFLYLYNVVINNISNVYYYIYIYSFTALLLGGWWAQQEVNWNGWWGWDPVEILNLFIVMFLLFILHSNVIIYGYYWQKYEISSNFLFIIFSFIGTRFGIFNSIHSFLDISFSLQYFYNVNLIYLFLVITFLKLIISHIREYSGWNFILSLNYYFRFNKTAIIFITYTMYTAFLCREFFMYIDFTILKYSLFLSLLIFNVKYFLNIFIFILPYFEYLFTHLIFYMIAMFQNKKILMLHLIVCGFIICWMFLNFDFDFLGWCEIRPIIVYVENVKLNISSYIFALNIKKNMDIVQNMLFLEINNSFFKRNQQLFKLIDYNAINGFIYYYGVFEFYSFFIVFSNYFFLYIIISLINLGIMNSALLKTKQCSII